MVIPFCWLLAGTWNVIWVRLGCSLKFIVSFDMDQAVFWVVFFAVTIPKYNSPTLLLLSTCCDVLIYLSLSFILVLPKLCVEHHFHMAWYWCHLTVTRLVSLVEQEVPTLPQHMCSPAVFVWVRVARSFFLCNVLFIVVCSFVLFLLTIVLSVLWITASVYHFGIFRLFLSSSFWFWIALTLIDIKYKIL